MIQKASTIEHTRLDFENGLIVEIKIWKLPGPEAGKAITVTIEPKRSDTF
jgi:hypothetical protein